MEDLKLLITELMEYAVEDENYEAAIVLRDYLNNNHTPQTKTQTLRGDIEIIIGNPATGKINTTDTTTITTNTTIGKINSPQR